MNRRRLWILGIGLTLSCFIILPALGQTKEEGPSPPFKYKAGTEGVSRGCDGNLEINPQTLTFRCEAGLIEIPYAAITSMQYRSDVTKKVRKMKVNWKVSPPVAYPLLPSKKNRFFTVIYRVGGAPRVMVLEVEPSAMRPYLAELDLRTDKRVEVQSWEDY